MKIGGESRIYDILILTAVAVALSWGVGGYGLYEPHEAHYGGIARAMILRHDWIVPHLNGSPYLNKPPWMYWSIVVSYLLSGHFNEASARAPSVFYAWLGVLGAWLWAGQLWGRAAGRLAAMILATSVGWLIFTRQIMPDLPVTSLHLWSLYFMWACIREPDRRAWRIGLAVALSMGMMIKGPPAIIFSLLALVAWMIWRRRWFRLGKYGWFWILAMVLAPVAVWALIVDSRCPGFLHHILMNEMVLTVLDKSWPPDYRVAAVSGIGFLGMMAVWSAPWSLLLPQATRFVLSDRDPDRTDATNMLVLGTLIPVIFFLLTPTRLLYYGLPAISPYAVLCAGCLDRFASSISDGRWLRFGGAIFMIVGAAIFSAAFWIIPLVKDIPEIQAAPETLGFMKPTAFLLGTGLTALGLGLCFTRPHLGVVAFFMPMIFVFGVASRGFHAFEDIRSAKRMVAETEARIGKEALWISEGSKEIGASAGTAFYLGLDEQGHERTTRVMGDDERRPLPYFGEAPMNYATNHAELDALWHGDRPIVFFTDMMRRDFNADAPLLPKDADDPLGKYGFRKVYLNPAARKIIR